MYTGFTSKYEFYVHKCLFHIFVAGSMGTVAKDLSININYGIMMTGYEMVNVWF